MKPLALVLIVAGLSAAVFSQIGGGEGDFTVVVPDADASGPLGLGPEWVDRVLDVAGGLGLSAALAGFLELRRHERVLTTVMAVLLALGTAFLLWWLLSPPGALYGLDGEPFAFGWPAWAAAAELATATLAAALLARQPDAARAAPPPR